MAELILKRRNDWLSAEESELGDCQAKSNGG